MTLRTIARSAGRITSIAVAAGAMTLSTTATADAANKALMLNGIGIDKLPDVVMSNVLGGMFGGSNYIRECVDWPMQARPVTGPTSLPLDQSIKIGADNLDAAIKSSLAQLGTGESVTVVGLSAGALVADEELRRLVGVSDAPDTAKLKFIVVADSSRSRFNKSRYDEVLKYNYQTPPETKYNTTVVTQEYDGFADFPDQLSNTLAVSNAMAGAALSHVPAMATDLSKVPVRNITVTTNSLGGVTTSYLIPSKTLPLVQANPLLKPFEAQLRAKIDSAYARNRTAAAAISPAVAEASSPAVAQTAADDSDAAPIRVSPTELTDSETAPTAAAPAPAGKPRAASADSSAARAPHSGRGLSARQR